MKRMTLLEFADRKNFYGHKMLPDIECGESIVFPSKRKSAEKLTCQKKEYVPMQGVGRQEPYVCTASGIPCVGSISIINKFNNVVINGKMHPANDAEARGEHVLEIVPRKGQKIECGFSCNTGTLRCGTTQK